MKINWKLKNDIPNPESNDGFWYDLTGGGYIKPEQILADEKQLKKLQKAIEIVSSFEKMLKEEILEEEW